MGGAGETGVIGAEAHLDYMEDPLGDLALMYQLSSSPDICFSIGLLAGNLIPSMVRTTF